MTFKAGTRTVTDEQLIEMVKLREVYTRKEVAEVMGLTVPAIQSREKKYAKFIGPLPQMKKRPKYKGVRQVALTPESNVHTYLQAPGELSKAWL